MFRVLRLSRKRLLTKGFSAVKRIPDGQRFLVDGLRMAQEAMEPFVAHYRDQNTSGGITAPKETEPNPNAYREWYSAELIIRGEEKAIIGNVEVEGSAKLVADTVRWAADSFQDEHSAE